MAKFYLVGKVDGKLVKKGTSVNNINELFILRADKGDYIAQSVDGKRKILYKWIENELLWRDSRREK